MKLRIDLASLDAVQRTYRETSKGVSRLQKTQAEKKLAVVDERAFKSEVWTRDKSRCRKCGRKVVKCVARVPERGEVHHVYGRIGEFRFDSRFALLLCCECHEQVTGRVNERVMVAQKPVDNFERPDGRLLIDARKPVTFPKAV